MNESFCNGKTAVITGAGGLLGSAIARELVHGGARVALLGRDKSKLDKVADSIGAGSILSLSVDVTNTAAVRDAHVTIAKELGPVEFLINAAGGNQADATTTLTEFHPDELTGSLPSDARGFFNLDPDRYLDVLRANTLGTVIPCQVFGLDMARLGRGAILNFASMTSYRPLTRVPAYAMSKAGIVNFTQWLAAYLAPAGVRVNCVAPGFFVNERSRKILMDDQGNLTARGQGVISHTPQRRFGKAEDLVGCVMWLLDDQRANFVTGITVPVDGGFLSTPGM